MAAARQVPSPPAVPKKPPRAEGSYQKTTIFANLSVFENVRLAAQAHGGHALRMYGGTRNDRNVNARAIAAIEETGLGSRTHTPAKAMSHGEQRQLEIAMVIATEPKVILLDEPLAGMGHVVLEAFEQGRSRYFHIL